MASAQPDSTLDFERMQRRRQRVLAAFEPGEKLTAPQVCERLRIDLGPFGEPSAEYQAVICILVKETEYKKLSHNHNAEQESVYWLASAPA